MIIMEFIWCLYIAVLSTYPVMQRSPINFHFLRPSQLCQLLMGSLATHFACHKLMESLQAGYTDICIMVEGKFLPPYKRL